MIKKTVILPVSTPVEVDLKVDKNGQISLGIRINGSYCLLASGATMPKPGETLLTGSKTIGDIWK